MEEIFSMSDFADRGAASEEKFLKACLADARATNCTDAENIYCAGCGEEIPEPRRKAMPGCIYCISCQQIEERNGVDIAKGTGIAQRH
jgi:phage/conjugal plasmid C-4 type zinc finger TraR family protein